ncbi:hypothetical protein L6R50_12870 [Myxococcota bacterium]|nr:hypothetical protein [Myxococcota bacterium]
MPVRWESTWPEWAFTSEREQARQACERLSYFAAQGVEKVWWYTNEGETNVVGETGPLTEFYSFGLTADTLDDAAVPYPQRRKKLAFCALKRWNDFLDRYLSADIVLGLNGEAAGWDGVYAVLFRRSAESAAALEPPSDPSGDAPYDIGKWPYALVLWADARAYDWDAHGGGADEPPSKSFRVLFAKRDASTPPPKIVRMIPREERATTGLDAVVQPCVGSTELADGSVEVESPTVGAVDVDYQGGDLLVFEPDASPAGLVRRS